MEKPLKCVRSPKALFDFEPLSEARTPLADFFSILIESHSLEDKLIAPKAVCSSQIEEAKPKRVVKENYCLRLCDFKRIAAEPVYPIVIDGHSSLSLIVREIPHWVTILHQPLGYTYQSKAGIKMALTASLPNATEQ